MAQSLETQKMVRSKRHWQSGFHDPNAKVSAKDGATWISAIASETTKGVSRQTYHLWVHVKRLGYDLQVCKSSTHMPQAKHATRSFERCSQWKPANAPWMCLCQQGYQPKAYPSFQTTTWLHFMWGSLNSSSTAINRLYIPMSLMSKPRTGIPSRPAHGQAHLQLGLFLDRFLWCFYMSFCLTVVSVRLRGLNGSCHFPTGPRQGANQGPHFQQHLQQSWPVSKKDFVKNTSKGEWPC